MPKSIEEKFPSRDTKLSNVDKGTLNLIYEYCLFQISRQDSQITSIHNRAGMLIGFLGVLLVGIVSFGNNIIHSGIFYIGMICLVSSLGSALYALLPKGYKDLNPYELYNVSIYDKEKSIKALMADGLGIHYEINAYLIRKKNISLLITVLLLFFSILIFISNYVIGILDS